MTDEMDVMEAVRKAVMTRLASFMDEPVELDGRTVLIDFPDPDRMARDSVMWITPDWENIEELSVASDVSTLHISVFIICKGAPSTVLVERVFAMWTGFYRMMRADPTLSGAVAYSRVTDMDYYPALTAGRTHVGIEANVELQWARDFQED